jgi:hypothetical protein
MLEPWMVAVGVGAVALLVYLRTMCRTIYVGDSGELAAAVHVLGIPHPPGYPLYVLLGKLFSVIVPVGTPALRLNLFSAFCSTAAVIFLCLTLNLLGFDKWLAAGVTLSFAFSASLWSQSGIPRVYALGALVSSLATFFYAKWHVNPEQTRWLLAAALVVGLGLANHPVVGAHLPAIMAAVLIRQPQLWRDWLLWAAFAACVVPGLLLYFTWIPLRARSKPVVNWGNIHDVKSLRDFLQRREYWRHRWVHSPRMAMEVILFYTRRVGIEYGFLGSAAAVVGLPLVVMRAPAPAAMVGVLVALNAFSMIAHARREDIFHWTRYMITAWYALSLPLAFGWQLMLGAFPEPSRPYLSFLPGLVLVVTQFRRQDLSRHRYADEYNRRILQSLPENATLIAQDDNVVFPLMYLKYAEGLRPDVKLLEQGVHQLAELRFNPKRDVVYCTHWQAAFNTPPSQRGPGLRLIGEGLLYRIVTTDMNWQPRNLWDAHLVPDMEDESIPKNYLTRCLLGHVYFMRAEWELPRDAVTAAAWYQRAARMAYDNAVLHYNLGLTYERQAWKKLSEDEFAIAKGIDPKYARHPPKGATPP